MQAAQIIVLATPVFLLLIALEWLWGWRQGRQTYRLHDAMASIGLGIVSQLVAVLTQVFGLSVYTLVHERAAVWALPADSPLVWMAALLLYDLAYYALHRAGHRVALLWAAHAVHHQSEDYNLSTALRQTGTGWLFGWIFYLPLAVIGFPPVVVASVALVDLLYQFWVHTQHIGRLGAFDRWFCSPSNHRVHHAVNDAYLDRNYGGILIVWDRLFGTFAEERDDEPCVYGTRSPLRSWDPVRANLQVYAQLWSASRQARRWGDRWRVWLRPPGWRPGGGAAAPFDPHGLVRFAPQTSRAANLAAVFAFLLALAGATVLLWRAHQWSAPALLAGSAGLLLLLCGVAALGERGPSVPGSGTSAPFGAD